MIRFQTCLSALALSAFATNVIAQSQQCFTAAVPDQLTDWMSSITVPKFDSNLGDLQAVSVELQARIEGSARTENFGPASCTTTLTFSATLQVFGPDGVTLIVQADPITMFTDLLGPYDGTLDFDGPSGESHDGIVATATQTATYTDPPDDLSAFIGAPLAGETITLPANATGLSSAIGCGGIIVQFTQTASAQVNVCYTYAPNSPPTFPSCVTQMGSVGVPLSFQVCAVDSNPGDLVTLTHGTLPPGLTVTPDIATGNPICVTVDWTPMNSDVGNHVVVFTATDQHLRTATCAITIILGECHMLFGMQSGSSQYTIFGHLYDTQLAGVRRWFPVTMEENPSYPYALLPRTFYVQVVMYNPDVFPSNPSQWSYAMRVDKVLPNQLTYSYEGTQNGIPIQATTFTVNDTLRVRFPFQIIGM